MTEAGTELIAVTGLAGRFPGAQDPYALWANLRHGVTSITAFPDAPTRVPGYLPAFGALNGADAFDANFFGCTPREALLIDPQQRLFLECCWEALEDAGCDATAPPGSVGVFAGGSTTLYRETLLRHPEATGRVSDLELRLATDVDFLTTRVAHRLGLDGPAVTVQTACSTSLVAVHTAAQALLAGECDLALAGGACVDVPIRHSDYVPGGVVSPDGHCRAFDAQARGTVMGNAVGVVVLRPLRAALAAGDHVHAVLLATAVNNDGARKPNYMAPSVAGQRDAVRTTHVVADIAPDTIGYVEAHGTGTVLGDQIEIAALTEAFRDGTDERGFCRLGSVKSVIGHTDAAAGVAGLIKGVLCVEHGVIPPTPHLTEPHPQLRLDGSPFVIDGALTRWEPADGPRRAGVSSFGIGGTNAHAIVEQPPRADRSPRTSGRPELLVVSARTREELERARGRLADHLDSHPDTPLSDVAWTLQTGRADFPHRASLVADDVPAAAAGLRRAPADAPPVDGPRTVVFQFPGHGSHHVGMGRRLYDLDPAYRDALDICAELLLPALGTDIRTVLHPAAGAEPAAAEVLEDLRVAQPTVLAVEYALAALWRRRGIEPAAVVGHSLGAYAAACVAGVMALPDALRLVMERGRLLGTLPRGRMVAVEAGADAVAVLLPETVELAAVNGPARCVLAGPDDAVAHVAARLTEAGIRTRTVRGTGSGHNALVERILTEFTAIAEDIEMRPPAIPWLSDRTGHWVNAAQAPAAGYWAAHMRGTVRYDAVLQTLLADPGRTLLEVGPGRTLTAFASGHPDFTDAHTAAHSLPHPLDPEPEPHRVLTAAGTLWCAGVPVDWNRMRGRQGAHKTPLPTYPFTRERYSPLPADPELHECPPQAAPRGAAVPPECHADSAWRIAAECGRLLGRDGFGVDEDFFTHGGDSMAALRLCAFIREDLEAVVEVKEVFTRRTPAALAEAVENRMSELNGR